jgi:hypothetical protein
MPLIAWIMTLVLLVLHQDWWLWDNQTMLFGFVPVGLGWHIGISISASAMWAWIVWCRWPADLEDEDLSGQTGAGS